MAKRTTPKGATRAGSANTGSAKTGSADDGEIDGLLVQLSTALLGDYFSEPDNQSEYKRRYPARTSPVLQDPGLLRDDPPIAEEKVRAIRWRLDALTSRNGVRVTLKHRHFSAAVEGIWQFQQEILRGPRVIARTGAPATIRKAVEAALDDLLPPFLGMSGDLEALLTVLDDIDADDPLAANPEEEPPPANVADRQQVKEIVDRRARRPKAELPAADRAWLEMTPQVLPVLTEMTVRAMTEPSPHANRIAACLDLLTRQLEFVRYRQDRGWGWADRMLLDYQHRLIELGQEELLDQQDWFAMAAALTDARVPVSDNVQQALAEAGMAIAEPAPPEELLASLRAVSAEMATLVDSPFEVLEAMSSAAAVMPAALRCFMATELSLSPHAMLREAVPMMLLDANTAVRRAAGAAMEQIAGADTVSPDWLRRAITLRNWIPSADRSSVDRAIHKARLAGVPIGLWPGTQPGSALPAREDISFHASMVDGSGAQSILAVTRTGRLGMVAGVLLKHGTGIADAWIDVEAPRRVINGMIKEMKSAVVGDEVDRAYVDAAVQHAISAGLARGEVPNQKLLEIAEHTVSPDWRDRGLDVVPECQALMDGLDAADRAPQAREAAFQRLTAWMAAHDVSRSWFEDHHDVHRVLAAIPKRQRKEAVRVVLEDVLPGQRLAWAERFLLIALWCRAAMSVVHRSWLRDFAILAHSLASGQPIGDNPVMQRIAEQTVFAARSGGW
ncbi:hypothetical protein [Rhodopila sp.]|uniref:hypothetical protein n=1 Tax=Rhodopila sp. TaxID=2480087 RepID=UPI002BBEB76B|nr:hypothetical protein [Rhodopila sp.]HVZ07660.1 hypothetical protein [Rhodopila sp.]